MARLGLAIHECAKGTPTSQQAKLVDPKAKPWDDGGEIAWLVRRYASVRQVVAWGQSGLKESTRMPGGVFGLNMWLCQ